MAETVDGRILEGKNGNAVADLEFKLAHTGPSIPLCRTEFRPKLVSL
jgi:hypothetical protein